MYRQGKCTSVDQCAPGTRRYNYHSELAFLYHALCHKKPRHSQDKYESYSEISNSPQHTTEDVRIKTEIVDKPLDLKTKHEVQFLDKANQASTDKQSLEIKIDANTILPDDHFDDDRLFMNSLIPLFKKMNDDTRLLCRIEVLKIIRYALQGHKSFEALKVAEDSFFKDRMNGILKEEDQDSSLCKVSRSTVSSRPVRKKRIRSPSPMPIPIKKRGPGRPRKVRPPPSDSEEEPPRRRCPKLKVPPVEIAPANDVDDSLNKATSVDQLSTPMFMKMYNLARTEVPPSLIPTTQVPVKTEPESDEQKPT